MIAPDPVHCFSITFLNIDIPYFEGTVNQIYRPELQLNKANTLDTEVPFLDLHLSISIGFVSSKIYDKRDDFDFDIVNFFFLDVFLDNLLKHGYRYHNLRKAFSKFYSRHYELISKFNVTLQEMCCGFLLSREMWYRKSVLPGTGAG